MPANARDWNSLAIGPANTWPNKWLLFVFRCVWVCTTRFHADSVCGPVLFKYSMLASLSNVWDIIVHILVCVNVWYFSLGLYNVLTRWESFHTKQTIEAVGCSQDSIPIHSWRKWSAILLSPLSDLDGSLIWSPWLVLNLEFYPTTFLRFIPLKQTDWWWLSERTILRWSDPIFPSWEPYLRRLAAEDCPGSFSLPLNLLKLDYYISLECRLEIAFPMCYSCLPIQCLQNQLLLTHPCRQLGLATHYGAVRKTIIEL